MLDRGTCGKVLSKKYHTGLLRKRRRSVSPDTPKRQADRIMPTRAGVGNRPKGTETKPCRRSADSSESRSTCIIVNMRRRTFMQSMASMKSQSKLNQELCQVAFRGELSVLFSNGACFTRQSFSPIGISRPRSCHSSQFFHWSSVMIPHVTDARYLGGHRVWLKFDDGASGEVDLSDELDGPVFEPLKDEKFFRRFLVRYNTLSWENGADFAPEFLREKLAQQNIQSDRTDAGVEHAPNP